MNKEFLEALDELEREKNIPKEEIISAIETAVKTAYEKNFGGNTMERFRSSSSRMLLQR